jgi:hypothetical protein
MSVRKSPRELAGIAAPTVAKLLGTRRCLATASGTTALIIGIHVLDVDAGDEVIVSPFTFIASNHAIQINRVRVPTSRAPAGALRTPGQLGVNGTGAITPREETL